MSKIFYGTQRNDCIESTNLHARLTGFTDDTLNRIIDSESLQIQVLAEQAHNDKPVNTIKCANQYAGYIRSCSYATVRNAAAQVKVLVTQINIERAAKS